jgi:hypothetical protein
MGSKLVPKIGKKKKFLKILPALFLKIEISTYFFFVCRNFWLGMCSKEQNKIVLLKVYGKKWKMWGGLETLINTLGYCYFWTISTYIRIFFITFPQYLFKFKNKQKNYPNTTDQSETKKVVGRGKQVPSSCLAWGALTSLIKSHAECVHTGH